MRNFYYLSTLVFNFLAVNALHAQDFSNKGKDFWVGYGYHQQMTNGGGGGTQDMVLYFATEAVTTVTVTIPGTGYSQTYSNIPANTVFTSNPIPKSGAQDARLTGESISPEKKGIHITSDKPIVAYAHIYNQSVSGACILFPTNTLGKDYYSVNYKNISNSANANCWFYVVACDTGTTTVDITPVANTINHAAGVPFTVTLKQGEIYNVMGAITSNVNPYSSVDLTGSKIQSVSTGTGPCKKIGVFSGSGRISITCNGSSSSSDNYMVQSFPKSAWGKKYLTSPTGGLMPNNIFRVCVLDPTTVVKVNGIPVGLPLQNNFFYELPLTSAPQLIEADKAILVAQYITSQGACGNGAQPGDPEVIYLSPIEQNISRILWNATPNFSITQHFYNVIIPNTGTAISSFRLDGSPVSASSFIPHPRAPGYSYLTQPVAAGQHTVTSDSGFNAIAYGYGNAESYGYNAGTNVKDLYQYVTVKNAYATVNFPAACRNSPFLLSMTFPYEPAKIQWVFGPALNAMGIADITDNSPVYDSTWIANGKQLYLYKLNSPYFVTASGNYPIRLLAQNPTSEGCSGLQEIEYNLQVFDPPVSEFSFNNNGCVTMPVVFTNNSNTNGRSATSWYWSFDDGDSSNVKSPTHAYAGPGSYKVKFSLITDIGCISDTVTHTVTLNDLPIAKFGILNPPCQKKAITFSDSSSVTGGTLLAKWYWDFGDGSPVIAAASGINQTHTYLTAGNYTATLRVETVSGCQSNLFSFPISVHVSPVASFNLPNICLPLGSANFASSSTISDGSASLLTYTWDFGDGNNGTGANPTHTYAGVGPFNVVLTAVSNNGCSDDSMRVLNTISPEPQAAFNGPAEGCLGATINFNDLSTAGTSTITQWNWDFGDGTTSTLSNPTKNYAAAGTYTVKLDVTSAQGCQTVNNYATRSVLINALPTASFNVSSAACEGGGVTFSDASSPNGGSLTKWTWDFGDGSNAILTSGSSFNHNYTSAQTFNVSLNVETSKGCISNLVTQPVLVHSNPLAGFMSPQVCLADPFAAFTDSSKINSGSIISWDWNFGDPNANAANPNTSNVQNPNHHYAVVGPYTATLIATSSAGCKDTISQTFTVNGSVPVAGFTIQNSSTLCSNQATAIVDGSTVDFGSLVKIEIYWDYANDPTVKTIDNSPLAGRIYTHNYPEFGAPLSKTYTVRYVAYSGSNCVNTTSQDITLLATPALQFDAVPPVCSDAPSFQLTQAKLLNGLPGIGAYSGAGVISSTGIFSPAEATPGNVALRYTYDADNGCSNRVDGAVEVYPTPGVNAGPDKVVLEGGSVTLTPALNAGLPVTYMWSPAIGVNDPSAAFAVVTPTQDMTYTLTVTSNAGCKGSDQVFVKFLKDPVVPNIFSPNGDGVHDKWEINFLDNYPGCTVEIYNRYGQLIFRSEGYSRPWDGRINGKDVPLGTYYYIVDPKSGRKKITGYVDIIR